MKTRRNFLKTSTSALLASLSGSQLLGESTQKHPNVIFIFSDDQRFDTISALGNPHIKTPNLDRLAKQSFVFRQAYNFGGNAGAVCVPARNMVMTGKTFFNFDAGIFDKGLGPTLPKQMKAAGYQTFYREKSGSKNLKYIRSQFDDIKDSNMVKELRTGYAARNMINESINFLETKRDAHKPFFMYLGLPCPHDPRWSAKEFRDQYKPEDIPVPENFLPQHKYDMGMMTIRDECLEKWPRTRKAIQRHLLDYYALITSMDHDIGRLLEFVNKSGLKDNTIVVFSSDQGLAMGSHGLMGKQNLYEDTQKVPLLFSGPGIQPGESSAFAYLHDIFPTLCNLSGIEQPTHIDGKSLTDIISGKASSIRDSVMLAYINSQRSIRDKRWKLIQLTEINKTLLFDLEKDPWETRDLSSDPEHKKTIDRLLVLLKNEQKKVNDKLPLFAKNPKPALFVAPEKKIRTRFPAGGLAPGLPTKVSL